MAANPDIKTSNRVYGLALLFLMGYRITRASHQETLRRLAANAEQVANPAE